MINRSSGVSISHMINKVILSIHSPYIGSAANKTCVNISFNFVHPTFSHFFCSHAFTAPEDISMTLHRVDVGHLLYYKLNFLKTISQKPNVKPLCENPPMHTLRRGYTQIVNRHYFTQLLEIQFHRNSSAGTVYKL